MAELEINITWRYINMEDEKGMERLLDYHNRLYWLGNDWSIRLRVWRVEASAERPTGIKYPFTLHDEAATRLLGFDNAHAVEGSAAFDHRHRFRRVKTVMPYEYESADKLLSDFLTEVDKACRAEGIPSEVIGEELMGWQTEGDGNDA
jgi:hypothetical protein